MLKSLFEGVFVILLILGGLTVYLHYAKNIDHFCTLDDNHEKELCFDFWRLKSRTKEEFDKWVEDKNQMEK